MKDYEFKISQFIDNELSINEQQELFRFLSESQEAQQILIDFMEMKKETKSFYAGMNIEVDGSQIAAISENSKSEKAKKYKTMFYVSTAAAVLLAFALLLNSFKENPFLAKYQNLQTEMVTLQEKYTEALNKEVKLLELNNQLYIETQKLKTTRIVINKNNDIKAPRMKPSKVSKNQRNPKHKDHNNYLASIPTYTITKDDFLGQQIIGN